MADDQVHTAQMHAVAATCHEIIDLAGGNPANPLLDYPLLFKKSSRRISPGFAWPVTARMRRTPSLRAIRQKLKPPDASRRDRVQSGQCRSSSTYDQLLIEPLSAYKLKVLQFIAAGPSNKQIAAELVVSPNMDKKHTTHISDRLAVRGRI